MSTPTTSLISSRNMAPLPESASEEEDIVLLHHQVTLDNSRTRQEHQTKATEKQEQPRDMAALPEKNTNPKELISETKEQPRNVSDTTDQASESQDQASEFEYQTTDHVAVSPEQASESEGQALEAVQATAPLSKEWEVETGSDSTDGGSSELQVEYPLH